MSDPLAKVGLHFDELNKVRIVEPEVANETSLLKEECNEFVQSLEAFKNISNGFIKLIDSLAKEVDREKIMAIGARNLVKSMAKQRDAQEQQLQLLVDVIAFTTSEIE
ncbi:intraflagellar transport 20 isoform X2 [Rhodnius prolixus]|uniref:intraflagellar transport 20 isoform X2 n=1 Tax=Rhodnius prolixus TaxID=13249 RepID=UPI003D187DED